MLNLKKLFKIPNPVELGVSTRNSLPMRMFNNTNEFCWEDYYELIKKKYPVRYFLSETLRKFIYSKIINPINKIYYWFVSHFVPSRRYHMLDLRQPCDADDLSNIDCYRYGWSDVPEKMLYAMFNLLKEYLNENPYDLTIDYSIEEINSDPGMKEQYELLLEAKAIHQWWFGERKLELKERDDMLEIWSRTKKIKDPKEVIYFQKLSKIEKKMENKIDSMIARLMKIRRSLWT